MYLKRDNVRIKRIVLDLHDVIVNLQRRLFSLNLNSLFYLKLKTRRNKDKRGYSYSKNQRELQAAVENLNAL